MAIITSGAGGAAGGGGEQGLYKILVDIQADLAALRTTLNAHVHSGVTTGGGNSGAPTTTAAALLTVNRGDPGVG